MLGSGIAHPANPSPEELGNGLRAMLASQDAVREITEHLEGVDARWMIDVLDCVCRSRRALYVSVYAANQGFAVYP